MAVGGVNYGIDHQGPSHEPESNPCAGRGPLCADVGGDDEGFDRDKTEKELRDLKEIYQHPDTPQKVKSKAKKRARELRRKLSKKAHGADKNNENKPDQDKKRTGEVAAATAAVAVTVAVAKTTARFFLTLAFAFGGS